jgi:hypothetical protein
MLLEIVNEPKNYVKNGSHTVGPATSTHVDYYNHFSAMLWPFGYIFIIRRKVLYPDVQMKI